MDRVLLVAHTKRSAAALENFLRECGVQAEFLVSLSSVDARRRLADQDFDLVIINAPLSDEFGHELAQDMAQYTVAGVLLLIAADEADAVASKVTDTGVLILPKPVSRLLLQQCIRLAQASHRRLGKLIDENRRLRQKLEDQRLISRAKCILIECCGMTEPEAHAYIERRAMDERKTKRAVACDILQADTD